MDKRLAWVDGYAMGLITGLLIGAVVALGAYYHRPPPPPCQLPHPDVAVSIESPVRPAGFDYKNRGDE